MKKILLSMLAISVITISAIAQNEQKSEKEMHRGAGKGEKFGKRKQGGDHFKNLNLSEDQEVKMKVLNESFRKQMQDLQKDENITVKEQRARRAALAKQHKAEVDNLLTPEQKTKAQEMKKNHAEKGKKMMSERFEQTAKELNLSADQSSRFKTLNEGFRSKSQAIMQNASLSREQKKEQFKALHKQHSEELNSILTKEQQEKFKQSRKDKHGTKAV